jgi:acetyl-CoA synthetase (ADP-forming)
MSILSAARDLDPGAKVSVQRMVEPGVEIIVGTTTDPHFGSVLSVGFGGILVELLNDTTFGLIPLEKRDAWRMIRSLKGFPLLEGYRGHQGVSIDAIIAIMLKVSDMVWKQQEIVEMDLNPILVHEVSATVVDARIIVREEWS